MRTERVTFLTTPDHKAALDAFASASGRSMGHLLREASSRYIEGAGDEDEQALALVLPELEAGAEDVRRSIAAMRADIARACAAVDAVLDHPSA